MQIQDVSLFLGFPVDASFEEVLSKVDSKILALFVQEGVEGEYLHKTSKENIQYLGKAIGHPTGLNELELMESHIYSLLRKLVPDYPCEGTPLVLFTL